jgi:hypothetical protein
LDDIKAYLINLDYRIKNRIYDATQVLELRLKSMTDEANQRVMTPFLEFKKEAHSRLLKNEEYIGMLHQEFTVIQEKMEKKDIEPRNIVKDIVEELEAKILHIYNLVS